MNAKVVAILLALLMLGSGGVLGYSTMQNPDDNIVENGDPECSTLEAGDPENGGGPPPWAPDHARERREWSQSGQEGPPPWAPDHARERREWSQSGQEGPPPWANGNANRNGAENGNGNGNRNES